MVTQRTQGLYRVFLLCQILIVAVLFWFGVWVMVTFYSSGAELTWRRYSIYCGLLVLGMTLESLSRDGSKNYFLQNELLRQHRLRLRQRSRKRTLVFHFFPFWCGRNLLQSPVNAAPANNWRRELVRWYPTMQQ